jgi:hypothetical protein
MRAMDLDDCELQEQIAYSDLAKKRLCKLTVAELRVLASHFFGPHHFLDGKAEMIDAIAEEHAEAVLSGGRWR